MTDTRTMKGEKIGKRLRRLRTERRLSQRELSGPGVSYAYISRIEAGQRNPSVKAIRVLADKLGVTPRYLEDGEPEPWESALEAVGLTLLDLAPAERERFVRAVEGAAHNAARIAALRIAAARSEDLADELQGQARQAHELADRLRRDATEASEALPTSPPLLELTQPAAAAV